MEFSAKVDDSAVQSMLSQLTGELAVSLARSMGVAGGEVIRDEAKARAPVESGGLRNAIYLAFQDARSAGAVAVYSVSWNKVKAPHGHLVEFGHWRYNKDINGRFLHSLRDGLKRGSGPEDHVPPGALDKPQWVAAHPFLRPAFDAAAGLAQAAMTMRARERLPELLSKSSVRASAASDTPAWKASAAPSGMRHAIPGAAMNLINPEWVKK